MATDFIQFLVQIAAGIVMFVIVVLRLGGAGSIMGMWSHLPAENSHLFNSPYTVGFALVFLIVSFFSYNGGNWGLATRYISSPDEKQASQAAYLSGILYLVWPLILFFPMWAAPLILPDLTHPSHSYGLLMLKLLPPGLVGLVSASLFAATMSMVASDITTLSAVITRDILPVISKRFRGKRTSMVTARLTTFIYAGLTIAIASQYHRFGGVIGLIVSWFGALVGPIAVPLLFGLLPVFRNCGPTGAISSIVGGLVAFIVTKSLALGSLTLDVGLPVIVSAIIYLVFAWLTPPERVSAETDHLLEDLKFGQSSSPDKKITVS
jgi:Na+/proline symporter